MANAKLCIMANSKLSIVANAKLCIMANCKLSIMAIAKLCIMANCKLCIIANAKLCIMAKAKHWFTTPSLQKGAGKRCAECGIVAERFNSITDYHRLPPNSNQ